MECLLGKEFAKSQGLKVSKLEIRKILPNLLTPSQFQKGTYYTISLFVIFHRCLKLATEWFLLIL